MRLTVGLLSILLLASCGGGGNSSNNSSNPITSTPQSNVGHAQGVYSGTTSNNSAFEAILLPNDTFYGIYGTVSGNVFLIGGMVTGQGSSGASTYTATISDFYFNGSISTGSVSASYVAGSNISGTVTETGNPMVSFSGSTIPVAQFSYNTAAKLSDISGSWAGMLLDGSTASVNIATSRVLHGERLRMLLLRHCYTGFFWEELF